MSVIAAHRFFIHPVKSHYIFSNIISAAKKNDAQCLEAVMHYFFDGNNSPVNQVDEICKKILGSVSSGKGNAEFSLGVTDLHKRMTNALRENKMPHEIIGMVLDQFKAFREKHQLKYIDVSCDLDSLLWKLTVKKIAHNPMQARSICNASMEAFHHSLQRKNNYNVALKVNANTNQASLLKFNKLLGFIELVDEDPVKPSSLNGGDFLPGFIGDRFKKLTQSMFHGKNVFNSAVEIMSLSKEYNVFFTGKSGLLQSKNKTPVFTEKFARGVLLEAYEKEGGKAVITQTIALSKRLYNSKLHTFLFTLKKSPEQVDLLRDPKFCGEKYADKVSDLFDSIKKQNPHWVNLYHDDFVPGPDFTLYKRNGERFTLSEAIQKYMPDQLQTLNQMWLSASKNIEKNAALSHGKLYLCPQKQVTRKMRMA